VVGFDHVIRASGGAAIFLSMECVEYMGASWAFQFKPAVFDGAVATHPHRDIVPRLCAREMAIPAETGCKGAGMGIDEHVCATTRNLCPPVAYRPQLDTPGVPLPERGGPAGRAIHSWKEQAKRRRNGRFPR